MLKGLERTRGNTLTARQIDGYDCCICGADGRTTVMVPAGWLGGHQLHRCSPDCPDADGV